MIRDIKKQNSSCCCFSLYLYLSHLRFDSFFGFFFNFWLVGFWFGPPYFPVLSIFVHSLLTNHQPTPPYSRLLKSTNNPSPFPGPFFWFFGNSYRKLDLEERENQTNKQQNPFFFWWMDKLGSFARISTCSPSSAPFFLSSIYFFPFFFGCPLPPSVYLLTGGLISQPKKTTRNITVFFLPVLYPIIRSATHTHTHPP